VNADTLYEFNYILLSGFITALLGLSPGLLNMTAAKVNWKKKKCLWFVLAVYNYFFQAYIWILFARVIISDRYIFIT
jgi:hypothetical protein